MAINWETQPLESFTPWMSDVPLGNVRGKAKSQAAFVLLLPDKGPPSLVRLGELAPLENETEVGDAGERPRALEVDAAKASAAETDLLGLLARLVKEGSSGLLVRRGGRLAGVLARTTLLDLLPQNTFEPQGLMAVVPFIVYVCKQSGCEGIDYRAAVVTPPPDCPEDGTHGPMTRQKKKGAR